jgi:hypothetical protein
MGKVIFAFYLSGFRIWIGSGFNQVRGSGSVPGIRIQEGKNDPENKKKIRIIMF